MKKFISLTLIIFISIIFSCIPKNKSSESGKGEPADTNWYSKYTQEQVAPVNATLKNYYIIFDGSGSMAGRKLYEAKIAINKFISLIPESSNIGLLAFDANGVSERAKLGSGKDIIVSEVDKIIAADSTPLGESVEIALEKISIQAKKQLGYGEYNLIIITDGEATDLDRLKKIIGELLQTTPIIVHTIGFQIGQGHALNQPGKIYYKTANNVEELSEGLKGVLAESEDFSVTQFK